MPGEVDTTAADQNTEEQQTQEQQEQDTEFESGFDDKPTEDPPAKDETDKDEEKPEAASAEEPAAKEDPPAEEAPKTKVVSEAEWNELAAKAAAVDTLRAELTRKIDTAFGKVGGLERRLTEIQSKTPSGEAVEISDEDFAELKAEFPELADKTISGLRKVIGKLKGTSTTQSEAKAAPDPEEIARIATENAAALYAKRQELELAEDHPKWREIVGKQDDKDNEYRKWLATQSAEYQQKVNSTERASVISASIDKFLKDKTAADEAAEKARKDAEDKAKQKDTQRQKLAVAATPRSAASPSPRSTEKDEFEEGFNG